MLKGIKTTLMIVFASAMLVSCAGTGTTEEKEVTTDSTTVVSVTESVSVSDVSVTADSAQ
tara:strand:- start:5040 stop:5219 length:180 start_codon:yes stop_codon:yes gene_type:complete